MKRHQRNSLIAAGVLIFIAIVSCVTIKPVCRHIVLSQHAAAVDAGYEARIVTFKNCKEVEERTGYKYHQAVEVKVDGKWGNWLPQPFTSWTTTKKRPSGFIIKTTKPARKN